MVLPKSWSGRKVAKVSRCLARRAKMLVAEKGVLSSSNPKLGRTLSAQTEEEVKNFYLSDDISRIMPGKKDFVSVLAADRKREHKQKRLLLCSLKEAYSEFKGRHPDTKIGFSKFAMLRPRECILAGAAGTHSVCVCTIHQNVKLMMAGGKIESPTDGSFNHYRHCLAAMQCDPPNIDCHFYNCNQCPGTEPLHKSLQAAFDEHSIDTVEFKQWTTTDCATLETRVLQVDEFVDCFITTLLVHDFTAKMQSSFMQQKKESLKEGEFLVIADFSENFSFVVQDEVQSFHWNNSSATTHPFVCYYREKQDLKSLRYIIIRKHSA